MQAKEYRSDIDVLRAIAVLAVIFYHAHIPFFRGGYVGVSIFFVISGYLITGIIKRKLANGTFSFLEFYENRVRRIFPALFVMVFTFVLFEWATAINLLSKQELFSSAKRVLLAVPNIYFWLNTNYFDPAAETMPLLHTWSLGVEEQYYFIFPLLLFGLTFWGRNNRNIVRILGALFLLSCVFSIIYVLYDQKFTFYMLPTRAWELLLGAILAYTEWTPVKQKQKVFCFSLGLLLMFCAMFFYTDNVYPGFYALFPCVGAFLYIAGATDLRSPFADTIIKNKVLVFIGVISYSLYLWHWPILVYYQNWLVRREIDLVSGCILLGIIFIAAAFSWKFIETPVRRKSLFKKHTVLWMSVGCCFGIFLLFVNNLKFVAFYEEKYTCTQAGHIENTVQNAKNRILLLGDSHAGHLTPAVNELSNQYHVAYDNFSMFPYQTYNEFDSISRIQHKEEGYQKFIPFLQAKKYDAAIVAYRYDYQVRGVDIVKKSSKFNPLLSLENKKQKDAYAVLYDALLETVQLLKKNGINTIYFVASLPQASANVPQSSNTLAQLLKFSTEEVNELLGESIAQYKERTAKTKEVLLKLAKEENIHLLNPAPYFANTGHSGYAVVDDRHAFYYDDDHLSIDGALLLKPLFEPIFAAMQENAEQENVNHTVEKDF